MVYVWTRTYSVGVPVMDILFYADMAYTWRSLDLFSHMFGYICACVYFRQVVCLQVAPYTTLYSESVNVLFYRLTTLFQQRHVLNTSSFFNTSMWTVQLSGSIPPEIGKLTGLLYLQLYNNQVRGVGGWRDGDRRG